MLSFWCHATEMRQAFQSVRSLGMGGAYVYSDSDAGVIFRNPAGLSRISGFRWSLFDIDFGLNNCEGISGCANYDVFKSYSYTGISSISPLFGKSIWLGFDGYSAIALPNFGFGVFGNAALTLRVENPAYPSIPLTYLSDYGFIMGGSFPLGPDISMGLAAKRIVRKGGSAALGASLLANASNSQNLIDQANQNGYGYGIDTGLLYTVRAPLSPSFGLSWQDAGSTAFTSTTSAAAPDRIKDNLTASTTFGAETTGLGFAAGLEYRHITDSDEQLGKKIHMGAEVSFLMFDFRTGLYQGYQTYGFGIDLLFMQLDAATYKVERGVYPGQTPDQRIEISLSMDFGFDPNLNLTDTGGRKRRLKQRR